MARVAGTVRATMRDRAIHSILVGGLLLGISCGGRTSPATQPTPAAFDPSASDAKAVQVVDEMMAKAGGAEAWAAVKQIRWEHKYFYDNELKSWVKHAWDLWNGRHRCETVVMDSYLDAMAENKPDLMKWNVGMYDLFDHEGGKGSALSSGRQVHSSDRRTIINNCYRSWQNHAYALTMIHKLKDPGVKLGYAGQLKDLEVKGVKTICQPACDSVKVTFVPEVGSDTYWLHINSDSKLPELVEKRAEAGRMAHMFDDWTEVKGLKFPQKLQNAGLTGEVITIENIRIGSPDGSLYIPPVR
jgi:hypothetical protein